MSESEQLLALLRDIQEPLAPEGVSLWLIAANVALLLLIVLGLLLRRRHRTESWRREAMQHISNAQTQPYETGVLELAKLLRRVMKYHGHDISSDGETWLLRLNDAFNTHWFTQAEGQLFGDALYQKKTGHRVSLPNLCKTLKRLIKSLPARPQRAEQRDSVDSSQPVGDSGPVSSTTLHSSSP